jgi:hypothetical protein
MSNFYECSYCHDVIKKPRNEEIDHICNSKQKYKYELNDLLERIEDEKTPHLKVILEDKHKKRIEELNEKLNIPFIHLINLSDIAKNMKISYDNVKKIVSKKYDIVSMAKENRDDMIEESDRIYNLDKALEYVIKKNDKKEKEKEIIEKSK